MTNVHLLNIPIEHWSLNIDHFNSGPPYGRYVYLRCYFVVTAR